jgi:hypothetical protein
MSQHHVSKTIRLTTFLGPQRLHNCTTIWCVGFKPSIDASPFLCLAIGRVAAIERGASTPGYVKLLLPPGQSRGNSYFGLVNFAALAQVRSWH